MLPELSTQCCVIHKVEIASRLIQVREPIKSFTELSIVVCEILLIVFAQSGDS